MAKGKKGPPYTDEPDCEYIVITQPYGIDKNAGPDRMNKAAVQRISSWVRLMLNDISVVEAVWYMRTRDEIIVQLVEGTNVEPILGAHKWPKIVQGFRGDPQAMSCVFKYNYRMHGDPGTHSWVDSVSSDEFPPKGIFANPYPSPSWARPRINLALPLPSTRQRTPTPPPEPEPVPIPAVDAQDHGAIPVAIDDTELSLKLASKMDPYEEEELAQQLLRGPPPAGRNDASDSVKSEPGYVPSAVMVSLFEALSQSRAPSAQTPVPVKPELSNQATASTSDAQAQVKAEASIREELANPAPSSNEWLETYARFQAQQRRPSAGRLPVKPEASEAALPATPYSKEWLDTFAQYQAQQGRPSPGYPLAKSVPARPSRPYEPTPDPRRGDRPSAVSVNSEPAHPRPTNLPPRPAEPTRDPRRRYLPADTPGTSSKRPQTETANSQDSWKRVKTENGR